MDYLVMNILTWPITYRKDAPPDVFDGALRLWMLTHNDVHISVDDFIAAGMRGDCGKFITATGYAYMIPEWSIPRGVLLSAVSDEMKATYTKIFTKDDIEAMGGDPTKQVKVAADKSEPRSWDAQAEEVQRLADHLLRRLAQGIDREGASAELAKLSAIIRGHQQREPDQDPSKLSDEELKDRLKK
jgi:hypothetical protein